MTALIESTDVRIGPASSTTSDGPFNAAAHGGSAQTRCLAAAMVTLLRATLRAAEDEDDQPSPEALARTIELLVELSDVVPEAVRRSAINIAPDGSVTIVLSLPDHEAEIRISSPNVDYDLSLFNRESEQETCSRPSSVAEVRHAIVRTL